MKRVVFLLLVVLFSMNSCSKKALPTQEVVDVVSTASIVTDGEALIKALSPDGFWLAGVLNDVTITKEFVVEGDFVHNEMLDRKLALYAQDENRVITDQYTLKAPKMVIKSPNFRITGGIFVGDIFVESEGFKLDKSSTVRGNIYFKTKALMDGFTMDETAVLKGQALVK